MPVGNVKNTLYSLALPLIGKRSRWKTVTGAPEKEAKSIARIFKKHRVVGASLQRFEKGRLTWLCNAGFAGEETPVSGDTLFRSASLAKTITALLVFRLQKKGLLDVREEVSAFLGYRVRNPHCPEAPITLAMLLSHTSSIKDSDEYYAKLHAPGQLPLLLSSPESYLPELPGGCFKYSNLGAGIIGCMLEKRFQMSIEELLKRELEPLNAPVTFDITTLPKDLLADSWHVLPPRQGFCGRERFMRSFPIEKPDPDSHYLLAAGNAYLTAPALGRLALAMADPASDFLSPEGLSMMKTPLSRWPEDGVKMGHGMGLFKVEDDTVANRAVYGHQGFAYGAVNGLFFDDEGNGFACLNSGVSEARSGHLALFYRDLLRHFWRGEDAK